MKILLINPNRFRTPPVPPVGLEYIAGHLMHGGHSVELLDLCFSENVHGDVDSACASFQPDVAGITIRNIDSALYRHNEFFLDGIREIVHHIRSGHGLRTMIGGTGVSVDPEGILAYVNADYAFAGPAEHSVNQAVDEIIRSEKERKIIRCRSMPDAGCFRSTVNTDYRRYFEHGGIAGFETHRGCSSSCVYCVEAGTPVSYREIETVIGEIGDLAVRGYDHFHLCDPEFNEDPDHAILFCESLLKLAPPIRWTAYMKPGGCGTMLLRAMRRAGVYLVTLTVDSFRRSNTYWSDVKRFISGARAAGIPVAVDLLTGFPYEDEDTRRRCLDLLRGCRPDSVNVNTYIRLYRPLRVTGMIRKDPDLRKNLLGNVDDGSFLRPVFYNKVSPGKLRELIGGDPLFRVDGLDKKVNYTRLPRD